MFFYELCRIRAITDVIFRFKLHFDKKKAGTTAFDNYQTMTILRSSELIPPNLGKWQFPFGVKAENKNDFMVTYYSLSQLEMSFNALFLKINHVGYHSDIGRYLEELWYRMAWLMVCPHPKETLDSADYRSPLTNRAKADLNANFLASPVEVESLFDEECKTIQKDMLEADLYICNRYFIYRCILRYCSLLTKTAYRSFIFTTVRILEPDAQLKEMSTWIQQWVNTKFDKVHTQVKKEVYDKFSAFLIPPSDREWVRYRYAQRYVSDSSVWDVLYPNLKAFMIATAARDIKKIYYRNDEQKENTDGTILECIVVRLMSMNLASFNIDFDKYFVANEKDLVNRIEQLRSKREMPILVQSFNRYCLLFRNPDVPGSPATLYEYKSIFDTIAALINTMIKYFGEGDKRSLVTLAIVRAINDSKKAFQQGAEKNRRKKKEDTDMSTAVSSTLQTRKTDDDDEDEEDKMAFF
jgi:hypothetical protein